ncbi:hypothetical protein BDW72DRAFT_130663 [Aspergillus terricola var. indicus]
MLHDTESAGTRMPSPTTPTPTSTTKDQTTSFDPRRRRKTVSIVQPNTHASQSHSIVESAHFSRRSTMDLPSRTRYPAGVHQIEPASPAMGSHYPEGHYLVKSKSSSRLRSAALERRLTISGDPHPRVTGKAGALTFAGTTPSTAPLPSPSLSPSGSIPPTSSPSSPSRLHQLASLSPIPRLPQSRFSFEVQSPLRKIALTSHLKTASVDRSIPAPESSRSPRHSSLYNGHRKSVPDFHSSHPDTKSASDPPVLSPTATATGQGGSSALRLDGGSTLSVLSPNAPKRRKSTLYSQQSPPDVKRRMPSSTATFVQGRSYADENGAAAKIDESRSRNEDIFLNIARSDSSRRESLGRSELRRSRLRMSGTGFRSSTSRVSSDLTPSPEQLSRSNTFESPLHPNSQNGFPSTRHSSLPYSYSASAHPLDETGRSPQLNFASSSHSTVGLPRSRLSRTNPEDEPIPERRASLHDPRSFRHSGLSTIRSSRQASASEVTEKPRYEPRQDGTESTLSTTAPSTVWDELEDLKSRIKKLELTGKLPPSSQEAMLSGDRPRTATTTVTTMSSSPRHRRTSVSGESDTITAQNPVHPLLQSALAKVRSVVNKDVYTALEATATDAMALSHILGTGKTPSGNVSIVNGYGSTERQSRRKADSVCRSLTELCLALSDEHHTKQQSSGDATFRISQSNTADEGTVTPTTLSYRKSINQDPEENAPRQSSGPRTASRLEARRASVANQGDLYPSPENPGQSTKLAHSPSAPATPATASRLSRLSVSMRTKRLQEDELSDYRSPHTRSVSRSMTDIGAASSTQKASPRQQSSFGYPAPRPISESQQSSQPRTPTNSQSGIPLRRSLMNPSHYTPAIPRANIQAGSRRYGLPSAAGSPVDDVPISPRQDAPQSRISAPSSKLASSYTPITQNRLRTNSLGGRRLGVRRPMSTVDTKQSKSFNDSID